MARLIHTMIRVFDEQSSLGFYESALGLKVEERFDFDGFSLIYLKNAESDAELELTVNHDRSAPYTHGDGYGHIAVTVTDVEAEHARMRAAGIAVGDIKSFDFKGVLLARFFFVVDPDGYKIEILQRHGRYQ